MTAKCPHISICICTYKRPDYLATLLGKLATQETGELFTYSILVVDNDHRRSAEPDVAEFAEKSRISIQYFVEPRQNIALARNMAVRNARGEFLAFIDDDEIPPNSWLKTLYVECETRNVDGVLGPVKPKYENEPPKWVIEGGFYDRPSYATGIIIDASKGRTGNVLLKKSIFDGEDELFRPEFRSGEDQDFFGRMITKGNIFTWCNEAAVYEWVPASRWGKKFLVKRALLRGAMNALQPNLGVKDALKSMFAITIYSAVIPLALVVGNPKWMLYVVSLCDHLGKLLAMVGIDPVNKQYITE
jgi:glycosyltransferase involved in cell wall biosynthesis